MITFVAKIVIFYDMKRLAVILLAISMIGCSKNEETILPNPFFEQWTTPYGVPPFESIRTYHYEPAFERAMSLHNEEIAAIVTCSDEPTFENTIAAMDRSGRMLSDVSNIFGMICAAETNDQLQELEGKIMPQMAAHNDAILMNENLFKRVKATPDICELRNMINVGYLITRWALERKESRGLHYTIDYPKHAYDQE